jgi:hypothetical protein
MSPLAAIRSQIACAARSLRAFAHGGLLNFEAVLVEAGDKQRVAPVEAHESLDRIGRYAFVGVADMRRAIGVGDRRGDVEAAHARRPRSFCRL